MEVRAETKYWLDINHPNYKRWERSREISEERGKFVELILSQMIHCEDLTILDLGSGEGGTSKILSKSNSVISFDISTTRLLRQNEKKSNPHLISGSSSSLPFKENSFDVIILQDVLEHLNGREQIINALYYLLKNEGIIYLSTPNKLSLLNVIADPHWGVPFVSLMKREKVKRYFLKHFRKSEQDRKDIAELLSLKSLKKLFSEKFDIRLITKTAVSELFKGNEGIIWSKFHLRLIKFLSRLKLDGIILKISNDNFGLVNKYFTPTFYFILKKKSN